MSSEVWVALISGAAVILAAVLGVAGAVGASRTRLPRQLRQAKYLASELDAMAPDSPEQTLARSVHDDLVVDWALAAASYSYDDFNAAARFLTVFGAVITVSGLIGMSAAFITAAFVGGIETSPQDLPPVVTNIGVPALMAVLVGGCILLIGGFLYLLSRKGGSVNMAVIRRAHNLRDSVRTVHDNAMKSHRAERRAATSSKIRRSWNRWFRRTPEPPPRTPDSP